MPRISSFYGIVIAMYYNDHFPSHFHAIFGEHEAQIDIATLEEIRGSLPPRALRLVREWAEIHRDELKFNWLRARQGLPLVTIDPLP
jgi:Domain of unknown function (DUF4160)